MGSIANCSWKISGDKISVTKYLNPHQSKPRDIPLKDDI